MRLLELVSQVSGFDSISHYEKIVLFSWHLHKYQNIGIITGASIRECYATVHAPAPNLSVYLNRMAAKKPPMLLRSKGGFELAGALRRELDTKYGVAPVIITVTKLLSDLPARVPDTAEKVFLAETLVCYRAGAFRAAIVMVWNLAFDHLTGWIVTDTSRLNQFNNAIATRFPKKGALKVGGQDDFAELKESETIDVCRTARILSKNLATILNEHLRRRNIAAHPSNLTVTQSQADHAITDLVNNVVLLLK